jgi:excisionase family DNA binding protein
MSSYVTTPARRAVIHALTWRVPIQAQELADYAGLEIGGANRYLGTLVTMRVLVLTAAGYVAGPQAEPWRKSQPKSRVGGNDPRYRRQKAVLDAWRKRAWEIDTGRVKVPVLTSEIVQMCQDQSNDVKECKNTDQEDVVTYTIKAVAEILNVSRQTVHTRISGGKIRTIRIGGVGNPRITAAELKRITEAT